MSATPSPASIDVRGLVRALVNPTSNQQYVQDQQTLTDCFKEPGLFLTLQEIAADRSLPRNERLLASVVTGRELRNKWRSKILVPEARKPEVRERLFSFLEEEDFGIARPQLGLLVSVARIELPRHFPNLPQLLLNPLLTCLSHLGTPSASSSSTTTVLLNTLWTINALVKEWRTVKLTAGAEVMKKLEEVFTPPVGRVLEIWAEKERNGEDDWVLGEAGRYAFKILARFGLWHWSKAKGLQTQDALNSIQVLLHHTVHHAPLIQSHRLRLISHPSGSHEDQTKLLKSLIKHLRAVGKWWRAMIGMDAKGFCKLDGATQGVGWWWGEVGGVVANSDGAVAEDDSDDTPYPKRFLLLGMLLFKDILPILAQDHKDIFNPHFILSAFHLLIDKLLPLTTNDLEALEDEPEEWLIRESADEEAWAFEFRPCAERVLISLNNACRTLPPDAKVIEPEMLKILSEAEAIAPTDLPTILRKEAVYCAMGRLSRALIAYGGVDFNGFLHGCSSWLGQPVPLLRILKRRLAWLIGEWATTDGQPSPAVNAQPSPTPAMAVKLDIVWQILVHLLNERGDASDKAVQLSTALSIKDCVDLWDVDISYFIPHLQPVTEGLIKLLGEASTLTGKRYVSETIVVIIDRTGEHIVPFLPGLARSIPGLWHAAAGLEGEWLFKASLVVLTSKLVSAAKDASDGLMDLVIPLIEESLVPPAKDFFEEDGLALWQTSLYNANSLYKPTPETGLIRLLPGLLNILSDNMDLLPKLVPLLDSYLLLDAPGIVQPFGGLTCKSVAHAIHVSKVNSENLRALLSTVSLLVRVTPLEQLAPLIVEASIFQYIVDALEDDKASGTVLAAYLEILARIVLADAGGFLQIVFESARVSGKDGSKMLEEVLDAMWRNFDYVGDPRARKAIAMAAGALLTTGHTQCLERLDGEFMNIFLDVLGESSDSIDEITGAETSVKPWKDMHETEWSEIENTAEGNRRTALETSDPAFSVPLKAYVINALTQAQSVGLGPYWDKADEGTKNSLQKFLS